MHERTGSLFEKNFQRIPAESERYKKHIVYYVHHNPIHHKLVEGYGDYKWTSYNDIVENRKTFVKSGEVVDWFNDIDNFVFFHQQKHDLYLLKGDSDLHSK